MSRLIRPNVVNRSTVIKKQPVINQPLSASNIPGYRVPGDSEISMSCTHDGLTDLLVIGYYTLGTGYQNEAGKLLASCVNQGLNYHLQGVKNLGDWQSNTRYKATFIKEMLLKYPDKRLLYVDCDAVFNSLPVLFKGYSADIAVRWQDFSYRKNECLSGTIYIENNLKTKSLCEKWEHINKVDVNRQRNLEQFNLDLAIKGMPDLKTKNLPAEYTFIFDSMRRIYPDAKPVIEHYQASRKYRRVI